MTHDQSPSDVADALQSSLMALQWRQRKLGCAIYEPNEAVISVMHDVAEESPFHVVQMMFRQFQPSHVVVPAHTDPNILALMSGSAEVTDPDDFSTRKLRRLLISRMLTIDEATAAANPIGAGSLSCLLRIPGDLQVSRIRWFALTNYMAINLDSLAKLQIVPSTPSQAHPNPIVDKPNHNEPSLMMMLMKECKTTGGKALLQSWLLKPLAVEPDWQERVTQLALIDQQLRVLNSPLELAKMPSTDILITNTDLWGWRHLSVLEDLLENGNKIAGLCEDVDVMELGEWHDLLVERIDMAASRRQQRLVFHRGLDANYDALNEVHDRLDDILVFYVLLIGAPALGRGGKRSRSDHSRLARAQRCVLSADGVPDRAGRWT